MKAAIAKARETLPKFWDVFDSRGPGEDDFSLKVMITDENGTEHFWVIDIERKEDQIFGTINNDPEVVGNVRMAERIQFPEEDISDWTYFRDGKMFGNYTLRALFKQLPQEEVEQYKKILADP